MNKTQLTFILLTLFSFLLTAQNKDLSLLTIPDSLKQDANSVIRYEHTNIEIYDASKMVVSKEVAITVLNKHGDNHGNIYLNYDNHTKIKSVHARIVNSSGDEIKKMKKNDFTDESAVDNGSLFSDDRILYYEHHTMSYPYTVVVEYELSTSNTAFIPTWYPINFFQVGIQESTYTLTYPENLNIISKEFNIENYPIENVSRKGHISYSLKNTKPIDYEILSPEFSNYGPLVKFVSDKFQLAGEYGEANNWKEYGKWYNDHLLKDRDEITEETKKDILGLVDGITDPKEKAKLVYNYMQNNTRYISVQIGIGGWKPMTALEVDKLGYGDCKALSNYTLALLKLVDVPSFYSEIYAGKGKRKYLDPQFVSTNSNHIILMVPFKKDTVWLECTNQKTPFGHLGSFTDDRDALVIKPGGAEIIRTKKYTDEENSQEISGELNIDNNGNIFASINIVSSGIQYDDHYRLSYLDADEKDKYYNNFFREINNLDLLKIDVKNNDKDIKFTEKIEFNAENYAVESGDKMLVRLNIVNTSQYIPKRIRNRKLPLEIQYGYIDKDDVIINLPTDYKIEAIASSNTVDTKFGSYSVEIEKISEKQLIYKRTLLVRQGLYSMNDYDAYRKFRKKINQLDNLKIVLTKIL